MKKTSDTLCGREGAFKETLKKKEQKLKAIEAERKQRILATRAANQEIGLAA